jgi:hypothetical protein
LEKLGENEGPGGAVNGKIMDSKIILSYVEQACDAVNFYDFSEANFCGASSIARLAASGRGG